MSFGLANMRVLPREALAEGNGPKLSGPTRNNRSSVAGEPVKVWSEGTPFSITARSK